MRVESTHASCPDCGSPFTAEAWADGLCLTCLAALARHDSGFDGVAPASQPSAGIAAAAETVPAPGQVLGDRYRIRSFLGSGGMGEVWLAFDLKLRVDVALKSLRPGLVADPGALETLHQEVRLAREVISPNVCRVFDLHEIGGQEWISMEHVDGTSLAEILANRGPLDLDEAAELAAQFLAGIEAIHDAGLVHRDVKPENLMVTRAGRVVVMDFGVAKILEAGKSRLISGTPAYMAPEQLRGEVLDARADVFSAGVVLAEMVAPAGPDAREHRRRVWEGIHAELPEIADTPWAEVIARAVVADREQRLGSAAALARALEEVTFSRREAAGTSGAAGAEDALPYSGLRWRTQDADGALLRDDLRHTVRRWQERGRPDYMLWEGRSRRERELWRKRYPGGLSRDERAFVDAVERRARRGRRRWLAVNAAFVVLVVLTAVATLWW